MYDLHIYITYIYTSYIIYIMYTKRKLNYTIEEGDSCIKIVYPLNKYINHI